MENVDFYIKRGDRSPSIAATLKDKNGSPIDLTGKSVRFHMRSFSTGALVVNQPATPDVDQVNNKGLVAYNWADGDTDQDGYHYAEWEVTLAAGVLQTFPTIGWHLIDISSDLDSPLVADADFLAIRRLRTMVAESSRDLYSDSLLDAIIISNAGDLNSAAAQVWREKAAEAAHLVDVGSGDKKRALSQLYNRFVSQAETYESAAGIGLSIDMTPERATVVRSIERA